TEPSHLLLGVEDDGRVTGSRPHHGTTTDTAKLAALIANRTRPALSVYIEAVALGSKTVLVIEVPPQRQPVCTSDGVFLRRALGGDGKPACVPMDGFAVQSLQADRGLLDPSAQIVAGIRWVDLDPLEFERFRRSVRERRGVATNPCWNCRLGTGQGTRSSRSQRQRARRAAGRVIAVRQGRCFA
ncbi:putative transcriptional regulator, partial [mine drainage metagenome]